MENMEMLKSGLREFGLDPHEWVLKIKVQFDDIKKVEVTPKNGDDVKFEGWVQADHWRSLALYG